MSRRAGSRFRDNKIKKLTRRHFRAVHWLSGSAQSQPAQQGFAGLGKDADGFAPVVPGKTFSFPEDHSQHPVLRVEGW